LEKAIGRRIEISDVVERARMLKTDDEIENIRKACEIARKGIKLARKIYLSEKRISEHNLAARIEYFMKKQGSEGTFEEGILLACGKNAAHIHAKPSDKIIDGQYLSIWEQNLAIIFPISAGLLQKEQKIMKLKSMPNS